MSNKGNAFIFALIWAFLMFIALAGIHLILGENDWLEKTINWVVPAAFGFLMGYRQALRDDNN